MTRQTAIKMIKRRALEAGLPDEVACHSFRGTGITEYLRNGGTLEIAAQIAGHESTRPPSSIIGLRNTHPTHFVMRNRTVALLSDATVIVEAAEKSGTEHQGWEALRLGRLVFILESMTHIKWAGDD